MGEALDSIPHHEAHCARVEVWPDALGSQLALDGQKILGDEVQRIIPGDRRELSAPLRTYAAQWLRQAVRVVNALAVSCDLGAYYTGRVGLVARAIEPADTVSSDNLNVEGAHGWAVVRADRGTSHNIRGRVHHLQPS